MSASPQLSPIMGSHRADRQQSNSPPLPQQQLSKRDKRRTHLQDKLDSMQTSFSANRDLHYREQLQAIQVDINLITNANPHTREVLPDQPDEIDSLVSNEVQRMMMKSMGNNTPLRAGKAYADFAKEVNDAIEDRDSVLTQHKRNFDVKMSEIAAHHKYKRRLAANEFKTLSNTVRDRLINSLTSKKARLYKDKELDISSDNVFLLHPSQYGLTNPASPGGIHGKRSTRHRREAEELPNFSESHKRKRKAQDSDESPAPQRPRLENGTSTPEWRAEKQHVHSVQFDAPLYSIEKLFTEKELTMTYNNAALAAYSFMLRPTQTADDVVSPPNGKSDSSSEHEKAGAAADAEGEDEDSPSGGVGMERQYSHATRSTRGNYLQTNMGLEVFPELNYPGTLDALSKQIPKMPPIINSLGVRNFTRPDTRFEVNGLSADDANAEFDLIRRARAYNDEKGAGRNLDLEIGAKSLLQQASQPRTFRDLLEAFTNPRDYNYIAQSTAKGMYVDIDQYIPVSSVRDELGGHAMMHQLSRGSSIGGAAMSRQATGDSITPKGRGRGKARAD